MNPTINAIQNAPPNPNTASLVVGRQGSHLPYRYSRTGRACFHASGSSTVRLAVIEYLGLDDSIGAVFGRFLVVTVSMERLKVFHLICAAKSLQDDMVKFDQVPLVDAIIMGVCVTLGDASLLLLGSVELQYLLKDERSLKQPSLFA
jgi:hypothetical protein